MNIKECKCSGCQLNQKWWYWMISTLWCLIMLGTASYAVFWLDRSNWWFLLALIICSMVSSSCRNKEENDE